MLGRACSLPGGQGTERDLPSSGLFILIAWPSPRKHQTSHFADEVHMWLHVEP